MKAVFIGGSGRSGTTMLGDMLGNHPAHVCTPETTYKVQLWGRGAWPARGDELGRHLTWLATQPKFRDAGIELNPAELAPSASFSDVLYALATAYGRATGKPGARVWIDHSPTNVRLAKTLLEQFPDATLVHLVRDGRAVAASTIPLDWGPNTALGCAHYWAHQLACGLAAETFAPDRVMRVRYEDLVTSPEPTLRRICDHAGIEFAPAMSTGGGFAVPHYTRRQHKLVGQPPDPSRLEAWRGKLAPRDVEIFEAEVEELLDMLGYERDYKGNARKASTFARISTEARDQLSMVKNRLRKRYRLRSR